MTIASRGQVMVEFAIILSVLFLASVASFYAIASVSNSTLNRTQSNVTNANLNPPSPPPLS